MATISRSVSNVPSALNQAWVCTWTPLANGDDGTPFENPGSSDRSVQITGTFGVGGTISLQGSNDGTNWAILTDPQGNALTFTAAKIEAVSELTRYIRPLVSAGDGTTSLTVSLLVSGNYRG